MAEDSGCPPQLMSFFTGLAAGEFTLYFAAAGTRSPRPGTWGGVAKHRDAGSGRRGALRSEVEKEFLGRQAEEG